MLPLKYHPRSLPTASSGRAPRPSYSPRVPRNRQRPLGPGSINNVCMLTDESGPRLLRVQSVYPSNGFADSGTLSSKFFSNWYLFAVGLALLSFASLQWVYHTLEATLASSPTLLRSVQVRQNGLSEDGSPCYGPVTLSAKVQPSGLGGRDHSTSTKSSRLNNAKFPGTLGVVGLVLGSSPFASIY